MHHLVRDEMTSALGIRPEFARTKCNVGPEGKRACPKRGRQLVRRWPGVNTGLHAHAETGWHRSPDRGRHSPPIGTVRRIEDGTSIVEKLRRNAIGFVLECIAGSVHGHAIAQTPRTSAAACASSRRSSCNRKRRRQAPGA
jgi:hypothetical protein